MHMHDYGFLQSWQGRPVSAQWSDRTGRLVRMSAVMVLPETRGLLLMKCNFSGSVAAASRKSSDARTNRAMQKGMFQVQSLLNWMCVEYNLNGHFMVSDQRSAHAYRIGHAQHQREPSQNTCRSGIRNCAIDQRQESWLCYISSTVLELLMRLTSFPIDTRDCKLLIWSQFFF